MGERGLSLEDWLQRIDSIGPAYLLIAIEQRLGPELSRRVTPEDIFQDVMVVLCQQAARLEWRGPAAFRAWVLTVIEHRIADAARGQGPADAKLAHPGHAAVDPALAEAVAHTTTPGRMAALLEEASAIREALSGLPDLDRRILIARIIEGRTLEGVASELGMTIGSVRHRLRMGAELYRIRLRRSLAQGDSSHAGDRGRR